VNGSDLNYVLPDALELVSLESHPNINGTLILPESRLEWQFETRENCLFPLSFASSSNTTQDSRLLQRTFLRSSPDKVCEIRTEKQANFTNFEG